MNDKHTKKLLEDFPEMFKHREDLQASLMAFGFECGDGWFDLVYELCKQIKDCYKGVIPEEFYVTQVKEKFGGLRFYISGAPMAVHDMIDQAEKKSFAICEHCGQPGKYRDDLPWILTLCDSCLDKHVLKSLGRERKPAEDFISDWQKKQRAPFVEVE